VSAVTGRAELVGLDLVLCASDGGRIKVKSGGTTKRPWYFSTEGVLASRRAKDPRLHTAVQAVFDAGSFSAPMGAARAAWANVGRPTRMSEMLLRKSYARLRTALGHGRKSERAECRSKFRPLYPE
jgi:hypothetical protein